MVHFLTYWDIITPHDSITDLANDFVVSLQDEKTAIYIINEVKNKFGLQGKLKNVIMKLFFDFLFKLCKSKCFYLFFVSSGQTDECMCKEGGTHNGGKPLNEFGICEYRCSRPFNGVRFCGEGPDYDVGDSIACPQPAPRNPTRFSISYESTLCCFNY